jgi:hypothetical protein
VAPLSARPTALASRFLNPEQSIPFDVALAMRAEVDSYRDTFR